jgi:hypothetical protein
MSDINATLEFRLCERDDGYIRGANGKLMVIQQKFSKELHWVPVGYTGDGWHHEWRDIVVVRGGKSDPDA